MIVLYDWLKDFLGEDAPPPSEIEKLLTFHSFEIDGIETIQDRTLIDVKVLPDRSSDCLSHRGIAHEIGTLTGKGLTDDPFKSEPILGPQLKGVEITIEDASLTRRFALARIDGITVKESPSWLRDRLHALGQRSINNVVDATNYVMLSLGQPLHAYDTKSITGADGRISIGVRHAKLAEKIRTLTKEMFELSPEIQVVVDMQNDALLGIAGIKGGERAEVTYETTSILLEAAQFDPASTHRASKQLKLETDASKRFANLVPPAIIPFALTYASKLIANLGGGTVTGYLDRYPNPLVNERVTVTLAEVNSLLGVRMRSKEVNEILRRLDFSFIESNEEWEVTAPFYRTDIAIKADVIAEIGRVYGYEHIIEVLPKKEVVKHVSKMQYYTDALRDELLKIGFSEVITSTFRNSDEICLQNALATDKAFLRSSLSGAIQETLEKNIQFLDLLGFDAIRVFEIGTVFTRIENKLKEHISLSVGARVKASGPSSGDEKLLDPVIAVLKEWGVTEGMIEKKGGILEINISELVTNLPTQTTYAPFTGGAVQEFTPYSVYPFISRDIALWVPGGTDPQSIGSLMESAAGRLLQRITLFDTFEKGNETSYAFRLVFQSFVRTLTDVEVAPIMEKITNECMQKGYRVR